MTTTIEFKAWPKIPRGGHENVTITEKIDGTNACIIIQNNQIVGIQSRNRFIVEGDDNYGFAKWVGENTEALLSLGDGYHYGEWAGEGIQKNPHNLKGKHFFLFDVARWNRENPNLPNCCDVVPTLYSGKITNDTISREMEYLKNYAQDNYYTPEGIIVWYHRARRYEKYTFRNPEGKWKQTTKEA